MKHSYNEHGRCAHCDVRRGSRASQDPCDALERRNQYERIMCTCTQRDKIDSANLPILVEWMKKHGFQRVAGADPQTCVVLNDLMNMTRADQYREA